MKSSGYRVLKSRKTDYPEPIILKKGDVVRVGKEYTEKETWRGWIWCEKNGEKGWVPHQILEKIEERQAKLIEDYDGTELAVEKDDVVEIERELNGWGWGRKVTDEKYGWIPLEILTRED